MKHYDTIIIGAGLAGCVLGYLLKQKNINVLIIEKQKLKTKEKLCGGFLTRRSYDLLSKIYDVKDIKKLITNNYVDVTISNNNLSFNIDGIDSYTVHRKRLDDFVLNQYLNIGGEIIDNTTFTNIDFDKNTLYIKENGYTYQNIVGADGVFSLLRKTVTRRNQKNNFAMEISNKDNKFKSLNIAFFNGFKGYGWIIPNEECNMIGIGNVAGISKIENNFIDYLHLLGIKELTGKKGAFLPTGDDIILMYSSNIFFVGDSAGLISPITGEGIYSAIYSAYVLSQNLNDKYVKEMNGIVKNIKRDLFFMKFVYNDKLRYYLFSRYNQSQLVNKLIRRFAKHIL